MSTKPTQPVIERRFTLGSVELRAPEAEGKPQKVRGYAALFGKRSENLGGADYQVFEVIDPGAFDDVLGNDVRCLFNHNPDMVLARSKAGKGTLAIGVDSTGLWYEFEPPATCCGEDLAESMKRGDVDQSSFAFTVAKDGQDWTEERKGDGPVVAVRAIKKVARLYDVSPVTYPAYPDTTAVMRDLETFQREHQPVPELQKTPNRDLWAARLGLRS
jgi:HK97 family phage prohead protease